MGTPLESAIKAVGMSGVSCLVADTDGIAGTEANAGAFADGTTAARMRVAGIDPSRALASNDAYSPFDSVGDLSFAGPTGTNVNDFRAIRIE